MQLISRLFFYCVCVYRWLSVSKNRKVAFRYFKMAVDLSLRKEKECKEAKGLAFISEIFSENALFLTEKEKEKFAKELNQDENVLKDLSVSYDMKQKVLTTNYKGIKLKYDPSDGSARLSF